MNNQSNSFGPVRFLDFLFRTPHWSLLALLALAGLAGSFALFGRGLTVSGIFVNDTFVFFDGIHRLSQGQVPHVDFSTPVGALAYSLPYWGYSILDAYGGAVELASILLATITIAILSPLLWHRTNLLFSVLILVVVIGIITIPIVPGFRAPDYSHGMHYNRWSWGILISLFVLALKPAGPKLPPVVTGALGTALLLLLFFIKISYFAVGLAFAILLIAFTDQRRREGLVVVAGTAIAIAIFWLLNSELISGYLSDILLAVRSSDDSELDRSYLGILRENKRDLALLGLALVASLALARRDWRDYLVFGFIASSGIAILSQNFQFVFIATFISAFAVLSTNQPNSNMRLRLANLVIFAAACLMVLPMARVWAGVALRLEKSVATNANWQIDVDGFERMFITDRAFFRHNPPPKIDPSELNVEAFLNGDHPVTGYSETTYIAALNDAVRLINENGARGKPILTLDFTNAVPLLVDAPRVAGGYSWLHLGRNVSAGTLPDGAEFFADFDFVIVPFGSLTSHKSEELRDLFGPYIAAHSEVIARSEYWILLQAHNG